MHTTKYLRAEAEAHAYALKSENVKNTMEWPSYVGAMQRNTNKTNTNYHVLQYQLL